MGRWIGMSDRQAAKYGCITSSTGVRTIRMGSRARRLPMTGSCARNGAKMATSRAQREVLQALEGRVQQLVAARARRELGLRRRDGREDELPPRRARACSLRPGTRGGGPMRARAVAAARRSAATGGAAASYVGGCCRSVGCLKRCGSCSRAALVLLHCCE